MDNPNQPIAAELEKLVQTTCREFAPLRMGITEFVILQDADQTPDWFVVIFFEELSKIRESLKSGACFELYHALLDEMNALPALENVPRWVSFEKGKRPVTRRESNDLYQALIKKRDRVTRNQGVAGVGDCATCGHDLRSHQLISFNKDGRDASEGWAICPEEDCTCFQTWKLD